jgi:chemotaxis methyl-accepting protein methylase
MERLELCYTPRFDPAVIEKELRRLLVLGAISDSDLERRAGALADRFNGYCTCYPLGLWAPGLIITREMRALTELYLPLGEIRRAFDRLFAAALRFSPFLAASAIHNSTDWLDLLQKLQPVVRRADPAYLLRCLLADEDYRCRFLFANFLPARYGGGFGRYPRQADFLRKWLTTNRPGLAGRVRGLDAACGCGEGTYELAMVLMESGLAATAVEVRGTTLEPLELFAAAHAYFPHDKTRQASFRQRLAPLFAGGTAPEIGFSREDLTTTAPPGEEGYDVILCNGLLGGPFIHDRGELLAIAGRLAGRLRTGGILLAANHFHGGWNKEVSNEALRGILARCGLGTAPVAEGVAGVKR